LNLPQLIGEQCRILYLPKEENQVVLGVAGSGKSVEAVCRAIWMSMMEPTEKFLLLTCNSEVNKQLKLMVGPDHPNIIISTIYSYCKEVLNKYSPDDGPLKQTSRKLNHSLVATTASEEANLMSEATDAVFNEYPDSTLWNKPDYSKFISNEIHWIQDNHIATDEQYEHVSRIGRGAERISNAQRPIMYEIFSLFQDLRIRERGKSFGFQDIYWYIPQLDIPEPDKAKYIIIDEVQDVSPAMFEALNNLIKTDGSWNVFGDLSQNIFGQRISWSSLGLDNIQKQYRLEKNYRNSNEISQLAKSLLDTNYFDHDNNNFIEPIPGPRQCGKPLVYQLNPNHEDWLNKLVRQAENGSCAIICLNRRDASRVRTLLTDNNISWCTSAESLKPNMVYVQSINKIKGLEFDNIILYGIDTGTDDMRSEVISNYDSTLLINNMTSDDFSIIAKCVYVAITRARNNLTLIYKNNFPYFLFPDSSLVQMEV